MTIESHKPLFPLSLALNEKNKNSKMVSQLSRFECISSSPLSLLSPLLLLVSAFISTSLALEDGQFNEIRLIARARTMGKQSSAIESEVVVGEFYSKANGLDRAKLEIHSQNFGHQQRPSNGSSDGTSERGSQMIEYFYAPERAQQLVKVSPRPQAGRGYECQLASLETGSSEMLVHDLFGSMADEVGELGGAQRWLSMQLIDGKTGEQRFPHLIGFARFWLLVQMNRDKLVLNKEAPSTWIRNHKVHPYKLAWTFTFGEREQVASGNLTLFVYMTEAGADNNNNEGRQQNEPLPLRIWLKLPGSEAELVVDYSTIGSPEAGVGMGHSSDAPDFYTLPLGQECSGAFDEPVRRKLLQLTPANEALRRLSERKVFSAQVHLEELYFRLRPYVLGRWFVAHDGLARVARFERLDGNEASRGSYTIEDPLAMRKYHITGSSSAGQLQAPSCYQTRSSFTTDWQWAPLLSADLVEMGRGRVRGLECLIYERLDDQLPALLMAHASYIDSGGLPRQAFEPQVRARGLSKQKFSLVYYVSSGARKLMRLEVYRRRVLLYKLELFNFQWQLQDSPSGHKSDQLFQLDNRCFASDGLDQLGAGSLEESLLNPLNGLKLDDSARLKFELTLLDLRQMKLLPDEENKLIEQAHQLLGPRARRNRALARGLAGRLVAPTRLMHLQSRLHLVDDSRRHTSGEAQERVSTLKLAVSLQVLQTSPMVYVARSVATGLQAAGRREPTGARTFDECFWDASRRMRLSDELLHSSQGRSSLLLFTFCQSLCLVDTEASYSRDMFDRFQLTSNVFMLNSSTREFPCEIMQLELEEEREKLAEAHPWPLLYQTLNKSMLGLKLLVDEQQANGSQLAPIRSMLGSEDESLADQVLEMKFLLNKLELENKNWLQRDEELGDSWHSSTLAPNLDGLAFGAEGALVERAQVGGLAEWSQFSSWHTELLQADETAECRSACLVDPNCRAYSVCLLSRKQQQLQRSTVECLLARVDLRSVELEKKLRAAIVESLSEKSANKAGSATSPRLISVEYLEENSTSQTVEFKLSSRCRARPKEALGSFKQQPQIQLRLSEVARANRLRLMRVEPARDLEHCAEQCLLNNAKYLKDLQLVRAEMEPSNARLAPDKEAAAASVRGKGERFRNLLGKLVKQLRSSSSWCSTLSFFNAQQVSDKAQRAQLLGKGDLAKPTGGLCAFGRRPASESASNSTTGAPQTETVFVDEANRLVHLESYDLIYGSLFKRLPGVRLEAAAAAAKWGQKFEQHQDVESCARACFTQQVDFGESDNGGQWCKSFDLIQTKSSSSSVGGQIWCVFHTITLAEARALERENAGEKLVKLKANEQSAGCFWHYETRLTLQADAQVWRSLHDLEATKRASPEAKRAFLQTFCVLLVCIVGLASGYLLTPKSLESLRSTIGQRSGDSRLFARATALVDDPHQADEDHVL